MTKFDVTYFKYNRNGENEKIKSELGIGKKRLITLLETPSFWLDVIHVEDAETGESYLDLSEEQSTLLNELKGGQNEI